jgi:DNA-binding NarL/FixJ family response regulator
MATKTFSSPHMILLADDYVPFRRELKKIIQEDPGLELVGEAGDGPELFDLLQEISPDLVALDICMPYLRAMEATRIIKKNYPQVKVLIMMMDPEEEYLTHALAAGADGVLLKQEVAAEFLLALETIRRGEVYLPRRPEGPSIPPMEPMSRFRTIGPDFL